MDNFIVLLASEVRALAKIASNKPTASAIRILVTSKEQPWDVLIRFNPSPMLFVLKQPSDKKWNQIEAAAQKGILKLQSEANVAQPEDCVVSFDSTSTMQRLATKDMGIGAAFLQGRVKLKGDRNALRSLVAPLRAAGQSFMATYERATRNVTFVDRAQWIPDRLRSRCFKCAEPFTMGKRRHHCRICGEVVCDGCSPYRVRGKRTCSKCYGAFSGPRLSGKKSTAQLIEQAQVKKISATASSLTSYTESLLRRIEALESDVSSSWSHWVSSLTLALLSAAAQLGFGFVVAPSLLYIHGWKLPLFLLMLSFYGMSSSLSQCFLSVCGFSLGAYCFHISSSDLNFAKDELFAHYIVSCVSFALFAAIALFRFFFGRLVRIYSVALRVILIYWLASKILSYFEMPTQDRAYLTLDRYLAPWVCKTIMELRSVFVKFGQYLGARSDTVSKEWNRVLATLQDDMPFDRTSYVRDLIDSKLGKDCFESFDEIPIASASIAQVHKGVLKGGQPVAVKIQHEGIVPIMKSDMKAYKRIIGFVAYLNPKFDSVKVVLQS